MEAWVVMLKAALGDGRRAQCPPYKPAISAQVTWLQSEVELQVTL